MVKWTSPPPFSSKEARKVVDGAIKNVFKRIKKSTR